MDGVNYYTGEFIDIEAITGFGARATGSSRDSISRTRLGTCRSRCTSWDADFAVWCHYKYLNGGPGCVAGCFVHERHGFARDPLPRMAGWWGHDKHSRFAMGPEFEPIPGAEGWQFSNPPLFSLAALLPSLELFSEVGMENLRAKSEVLTGFLDRALRHLFADWIEIITPMRTGAPRLPAFDSRETRRQADVLRTHRQRRHLRLARTGCDPPGTGAALQPLRGCWCGAWRCSHAQK